MIFATVMVGFAAMWSYNARSFYHANTQLLANNLARELIEKARAGRYDGIPMLKTEVDGAPEVTLTSKRNGTDTSITLSRGLDFREDVPLKDCREVTAIVRWVSGHQSHEIRLVTYLAKTM